MKVIDVELPNSVTLEVTQTDPGLKVGVIISQALAALCTKLILLWATGLFEHTMISTRQLESPQLLEPTLSTRPRILC